MIISCIVALCFVVAPGLLLGAEWVERETVTDRQGNLWLPTRWNPKSGTQMRFSAGTNGVTNVVLTLTSRKASLRFTPAEAFPENIQRNIQRHEAALPSKALDAAELLVKFRPDGWAVYIEQRPILHCARLLDGDIVVSQRKPDIPADEDAFFQRTGSFRFGDDFMTPEGEANALGQWQTIAGAWRLHTVIEDSAERGLLRQDNKKRKPTAAKSPNFYSLEATGTNATIVAGHEFYDLYDLSTAIRAQQGEMGLLFHYQEEGGCMGFTMRKTGDEHESELILWKAPLGPTGERTRIATARTRMVSGQWVNLKVTVSLNRVRCFVDGTCALDSQVELSAGGAFGLFANSGSAVRFDDVRAATNHDLDLDTMANLERHTLRETGDFLNAGREESLFPRDTVPLTLSPKKSDRPQELIVGSTEHDPHVFAATFTPRSVSYDVGLVAGYKGRNAPYFRFGYRRDRSGGYFQLDAVSPSGTRELESFRMPQPPAARAAPFKLMLDASDGRILRMYLDDKLILVHHTVKTLSGASGICVGPGTDISIADLAYIAARRNIHRNHFEKNRQFLTDRFMRHWSSPEGQWITLKDGTTWYKGDFFGRFDIRLPHLPGSEVHLGVGEGQTEGQIVAGMTTTNLSFTIAVDGPDGATPTTRVTLDELPTLDSAAVERATSVRWYTLHYEGYWFWVTSGTNVLFKAPLARRMSGRRVRLSGFSSRQLTYSKVQRYNVKDCLFTESLHEWVINGGRWEVINRFNCNTEWSHMNGESKENLAALWSKYRVEGDFCLELYAGIRHGWYKRLGDLNITVMNETTTPSDGYTVTCTGWDPDHSQRHTRLYHGGEILADTEKYLVPRHREGNKRRGHNPLVASGRDVHGAWYYIKLRRVDGRLQYFFDNVPVFDVEDTRPFDAGSFGVWTFMNSMMVARVKMAAEKISRSPVPIYPSSATTVRSGAFKASPADTLRWSAAGAPLVATTPSSWHASDDVGQAAMSWHLDPDGTPYFVVNSTLGSGTMHADADIPSARMDDIAGWSFEIKRTPGAMFNFHYALGIEKSQGVLTPSERLFHQIAGSGFSDGPCRMVAATHVPPVPTGPEWHTKGEWTRVTVWLDASHVSRGSQDRTRVRITGFGNLQPSDVLQGLKGNAPGEGYAVRNFTEIRYGTPLLAPEKDAGGTDVALTVRNPNTDSVLYKVDGLLTLSERLLSHSHEGLNELVVESRTSGGNRRFLLSWIDLPGTRSLHLDWSPREADALLLGAHSDYRDPRLTPLKVAVNGTAAPVEPLARNRYVVPLPRADDQRTNTFAVAIQTPGELLEETIDCTNQPPTGPVLMEIAGLPGVAATFENRSFPGLFGAPNTVQQLRRGDPEQGSFLAVQNRGTEARLKVAMSLSEPASMARHPLLQFRYRASEMARVSLAIDRKTVVGLGEAMPDAVTIRGSGELVRDGQWQTWYGLLADAVRDQPLSIRTIEATRFVLGSHHKVDQTGLHAHLHLDDIVLGPAVSPSRPLRITPRYFDLDGMGEVAWCLVSGATPFSDLDPATVAAIEWNRTAPGEEISPDTGRGDEGICRLLVKGVDIEGFESAVTDIPVLVDRTPFKPNVEFLKTDDPLCNESILSVALTHDGGAPLDASGLALSFNGKPCRMVSTGATYTHSRDHAAVALNWPLLLGPHLDKAANGQTNTIVLSGIVDGAGNATEDLEFEKTVDYAADKVPPTIMNVKFPENVFWATAASTSRKLKKLLHPVRNAAISVKRDAGSEPYFRVTSKAKSGGWLYTFNSKKTWDVSRHPFLAMRVRRPAYAESTKGRILLTFKVARLGTRYMSLSKHVRGRSSKHFSIPDPVVWQSGDWHDVIVDMRDVLRQEAPEDNLAAYRIAQMGATITQTRRSHPVDFQSLYVFGPWSADAAVTASAFDASGIDHSDWGRHRSSRRLASTPLQMLGDGTAHDWRTVAVRDKAGNLSDPIHVPLAGSSGGAL